MRWADLAFTASESLILLEDFGFEIDLHYVWSFYPAKQMVAKEFGIDLTQPFDEQYILRRYSDFEPLKFTELTALRITKKLIPAVTLADIVFDLDNAKKIWGDELVCYDCGEPVNKAPLASPNGDVLFGEARCTCSRQYENNIPSWEFKLKDMMYEAPFNAHSTKAHVMKEVHAKLSERSAASERLSEGREDGE